MGKLIDSVQIVASEEMEDIERIDSQIKALILSTEGTIPGSRGFGLTRDFLSENPMEARNLLAMELEEKCEEYVPDVSIAEVDMEYSMEGPLNLLIHVERRE